MSTYVNSDTMVARFSTDYSDRMIVDPNGIIKDLRAATKGVKYDTIVGRGSSGMLIVPIVARALRKNYLIIRKPEEVQSSHSSQHWMGKLGKRWIFLDDFTSSGNTFRKVRDGVREAITDAKRYQYDFDSELVGYFEYEKAERGFTHWNAEARPGYSDSFLDDTPGWEQIKAQREKERAEFKRREDAYYERLRKEEEGRRGLTPEPTTPGLNAEGAYDCGLPGCDLCAAANKRRAANQPVVKTLDEAVDELQMRNEITTDENGNYVLRPTYASVRITTNGV